MANEKTEANYSTSELAAYCLDISQKTQKILGHVDKAIDSKLAKDVVLQDKSLVQLQGCQGALKSMLGLVNEVKSSLAAVTSPEPVAVERASFSNS